MKFTDPVEALTYIDNNDIDDNGHPASHAAENDCKYDPIIIYDHAPVSIKVETAPGIQQSPPTGGSNLSKEETNTSKFVTMSNPEYIILTDSELEQVRRSYFEQKRLGTEHNVTLSKELFCQLIRNTMTNMISMARATEDSRYPTKHEVNAMAK
ncbi:hypothetical protein F2P81_025469 [Scophthalmus maximus]|uniref:Uncharacterized protein n=1 Tax=Scophthalmus maximus TaxID=52904 RepID=A0A6A4RSD5_SCOMX|nr:hypothetical protein F2P81_025469 [Scophthalmus maximus]